MRNYTIKRKTDTMIVRDYNTKARIAEYRLTPGQEESEVKALCRAVNKHMDNGGTLGNYQW